jgi:hypothetical protein
MPEVSPEQLAALRERIAHLTSQLEQARLGVKQWSDAAAHLSQSAAEARATTQGYGRGIGGALLGAKFRANMRHQATIRNAAIAKDVAEKRGKIADGKSKAQALVRRIQAELATTKEQYRSLTALAKTQGKPNISAAKESTETIALLHKLKEAYDLGLLTEQEYEEKRQKLVDGL